MSSYKCINCENKCFEFTEDGCISITLSNADLDIEGGEDSLKTALTKIIDEIVALKKDICDPCNKGAASTTVSTSPVVEDIGFVGVNLAKSKLGTAPIRLNVVPGKASTAVEYDATEAIAEVGAGSSITRVESFGMINGRSSKIYSSSSDVGSFTATPENFPVTVSIETTKVKEDGQEIMKFQKTLLNSSAVMDEYFEISDLQKVSMTKQSEVNEYLDSQVGNVKNKLKSIESINSNGKTGLNSILSDIHTEINTIKSDMSDTSEMDAIIKTLQDKITDQNTKLNNQASQILQLEQKYDELASA